VTVHDQHLAEVTRAGLTALSTVRLQLTLEKKGKSFQSLGNRENIENNKQQRIRGKELDDYPVRENCGVQKKVRLMSLFL